MVDAESPRAVRFTVSVQNVLLVRPYDFESEHCGR